MKDLLTANLYTISDNIERHYLKQYSKSNCSEEFLEFQKELAKQVVGAISHYTLPEIQLDDNFNPVADFTRKFLSGAYYTGVCKHAFNTYANNVMKTIELDATNEPVDNRSLSVEDNYEVTEMEERISAGYRAFGSMTTRYESILLKGMRKGLSVEKINAVMQVSGYERNLAEDVKYQRKIMEFRILCFFAQERQRLYDKSVVLKAMNRYGSMCKRFFGTKTLETLPSDDDLLFVAAGKFKKAERTPPTQNLPVKLEAEEVHNLAHNYDSNCKKSTTGAYLYSSKISFDGRKHDHAVVYINAAGSAYDQTTKETRRLSV